MVCCFLANDYDIFTVIFVGFDEIFTSVEESVGSFELCILIFTNNSLLPESFDFSLNLLSLTDTASKY